MSETTQLVQLVRAWPHRWGAGLVHRIDAERDQTFCGKSPGGCPGTPFDGTQAQVTCKSCLRAIAARVRMAELRADWARQDRQREREREEANRRWWADYNAYLLSPTWRAKRERVMKRAAGLCEGCGEQRAVQVHHFRYPQDCWPGSQEWVAREKLFDLRAICRNCHADVHGAAP